MAGFGRPLEREFCVSRKKVGRRLQPRVTHLSPVPVFQQGELTKCASISQPTASQKQVKGLIRLVLLSIAAVAAFLLLASAVSYTGRDAIAMKHVRMLAPRISLFHLG
jgi:hypothetical protein